MENKPWIGVDLDGTLAMYEPTAPYIIDEVGAPIWPMVNQVKEWLNEGIDVRIVTARANDGIAAHQAIRKWCANVIGQVLPITASKDYAMQVLYDDRAVQVERNTGRIIGG